MVRTSTKYYTIMSYHPESASANYILVTLHNFLWDVIKVVVKVSTQNLYQKTLRKIS